MPSLFDIEGGRVGGILDERDRHCPLLTAEHITVVTVVLVEVASCIGVVPHAAQDLGYEGKRVEGRCFSAASQEWLMAVLPTASC